MIIFDYSILTFHSTLHEVYSPTAETLRRRNVFRIMVDKRVELTLLRPSVMLTRTEISSCIYKGIANI